MDQAPEGSPYNASCSTLLSMDCQLMDQQSASKPNTNNNASLQQGNTNHKSSTGCLSSNIINDDHEREEQMEDNIIAHNGMLPGSVIFDMLSAMQFNSHSTINTIHESPNINYLNINTPPPLLKTNHSTNIMSTPDGTLPWHLNLYNNNIAITSQGHIDSAYVSSKDNNNAQQQSAPPSGFDPISSFLKLPVLTDQSKLEAVDPRLMSAYSSYYNHNKEDHYGSSNNNWFNSLQLESIRPDCSNVNNDDIEDEGHAVQYLDHNSMEGVSEETRLLMKLNGTHEEAAMSSHDVDAHDDHESFKASSMHMLSNCHNGEHLLYTLNEGAQIGGGQGSAMLDSMHMMMMGYNNDPRANVEYKGGKGGASSTVLGGNVKASRKRGVRGSTKNSEERESQRMTHIAVERNRRRQMNEHLRVLRALMPPSYIQRGDQASIIGGAIEFVRELEQLLQCLESQKRRRMMSNPANMSMQHAPSNPALPQGFMMQSSYGAPGSDDGVPQHHQDGAPSSTCVLDDGSLQNMHLNSLGLKEEVAQAKSPVADIEVKVVEGSEALIKILSQRRPHQLLHTIGALQDHLHFTILHTNVTTIDNTVLYSFTVKIQNARDYSSADQIATLVHEIFLEIINHNPMK